MVEDVQEEVLQKCCKLSGLGLYVTKLYTRGNRAVMAFDHSEKKAVHSMVVEGVLGRC